MNRGELRDFVRRQTDDLLTPYLVSDDDLDLDINEAIDEAAIRGGLISDQEPEDETIPLESGRAYYDYPFEVFIIQRAYLINDNHPLQYASPRYLDVNCPGWRANEGRPDYYLPDVGAGLLMLSPTPIYETGETPDNLRLRGYRRNFQPLKLDSDRIPLDKQYHRHLADWVIWRVLSMADTQLYDPDMATRHLTQFERHFGVRPSARTLEAWREIGGSTIVQARDIFTI